MFYPAPVPYELKVELPIAKQGDDWMEGGFNFSLNSKFFFLVI